MRASALVLLASAVVSRACVTEISDVATFKTKEADMHLIIDVRTWNEYTGSGDAACNSGSDKNKCNYGHHGSMFFLENPNRTDKAAVYKVSGSNTVDVAVLNALKACYGDQISTTKIMTSCHSGSRSGFFQDKLVEAGFKCENIYNFKPGAKGLYEAGEPMVNGTASPGIFDYSTCPADKTGLKDSTSDSVTNGAASWSFGLTAPLLIGLLM
mmetsp:Transcript_57643/g.160641  ORF Transcript_57643/g.160641 Transcript_57643/m.160641 type:complete len:212 (-) Transcript_57643:70-705(-)|eukprot:CAMPEP_0117557466 /NCGR_PEP_ID=MMETSP0784-20121206/52342_1 /TAXON_ID=39447 /ORGANISM="" /LENGTH=211 /DNA_ID=CAMNT_0005354779 /DNA_START=62 /DNA_END=697 /DNA_ORIENTATION=-